ncbi:ubiquitin-protein ligases [Striga asiatica]|uniref:Ubiquitin-protein ligases n=1 Tax=Striga asiatica TaxID=4170 RepID=A0A5A7PLW4_STRAF|nr:ubiquitin-protein ligases [Striga asiatica]
MAPAGERQNSDELVTLICSESNGSDPVNPSEIVISTPEIGSWDLPSIISHKAVKIKADPNRQVGISSVINSENLYHLNRILENPIRGFVKLLIEKSSYFRGLLSGSFSEAGLSSLSIHWELGSFLSVIRAIFGCEVEISSDNFILLNESVFIGSVSWERMQAALFFGVDILLSKCQVWLDELTSSGGHQEPRLCLVSLIQIWKYGLEHANDFVQNFCTSYLARNFTWAISFNCYTDIPGKLLCSCIQHSDLTVDSEKHLCDAVLVWINANTANLEGWSSDDLCDKMRMCLLPLWFAAGKRRSRFFSKFAAEATRDILNLSRHPCTSLTDIFEDGSSNHLKIRLTKYSQKLEISGCPQLTTGLFLLSMLPPYNADMISRKIMKFSVNQANCIGDSFQVSQVLGQMLTFEAVQELDISNCPSFSLDSAIDCFSKSFPSLKSLRAAYYLNFKSTKLFRLVEKLPLLCNIDLTVDINPVIPAKVSVTSSSSALMPERSTKSLDVYNCCSIASLSYRSRPWVPSIIKLTLEGRTDLSDTDLLTISQICCSLSFVNIKGCTSLTDHVLALCSSNSSGTQQYEKQSLLMAHRLQTLHIGGCNGVTGKVLSALMSGADHLRSLCLREIQGVDDALYIFPGNALEMLDVSDTKVSAAAICHVIHKNTGLKSLRARGCRHLVQQEGEDEEQKLYSVLGNLCKLEEIELGWGFSFFSLEALKPAIKTLRSLCVGLGGSLAPDGLKQLTTICPMLETLTLYFQAISDSAITDIIKNLPGLQSLALCYCFGDISLLSFKFGMPNLRSLKLERVAPWMTNEDLGTLAENCANLVDLSLIGCTFLDSVPIFLQKTLDMRYMAFELIRCFKDNPKDNATFSLLSVSFVGAQDIISSGWPGLTSLHLEECGKITSDGIRSLLDCSALEDLTIRHTGRGLPQNFIIYAASKLPMLRKISLDVCDAREGDFDLPHFANRYFVSIVKIARCKLQKSSVEVRNMEARKTPVHKETLVLAWNSEKLARTVVKERL